MLGIVWILREMRSLRGERSPISQKMLRPAGESLRRELEILDEKVDDIFVWTFFGPFLGAALLFTLGAGGKPTGSFSVAATIVVAAMFVFLVWKLINVINRRRDYRFCFAGERAVAEELNQLMLDGCRVFHDVPMEPYGNIDHVLVARTGIYAVETKARRKRNVHRKAPTGKRDYEVVFDGTMLRFPGGIDSRSLGQARQQAVRLHAFLSSALGESVEVRPILTFPGWFVTSSAKSDIKVLNPKLIRAAVVDSRLPALPKQLIERVSHQLEQKCRDVEF
jgi:hypothetical protein